MPAFHTGATPLLTCSLPMAWESSRWWPNCLRAYTHLGDPEEAPSFGPAQLQPLQPFGSEQWMKGHSLCLTFPLCHSTFQIKRNLIQFVKKRKCHLMFRPLLQVLEKSQLKLWNNNVWSHVRASNYIDCDKPYLDIIYCIVNMTYF